MKPIILAKKVWDHAVDISTRIKATYYTTPLFDYPGILTMFAGAQAALVAKDEEWINEVNSYLKKYPFEFEDPETFFRYNFDNYRVGGLGKGWMVMKGYFEDHKDILKEYAEKTLAAPRSDDGIICHPRIEPRIIWIDIVYAVTPYMLYAGLVFDEPRYIDFAVEQCFKMYDVFMDKSNGLLHQARGFMGDNTSISQDHWSRGNGWGIIGLCELVRYLPKDHKAYNEAVERFKAHCEALIKYQDYRGLWKQSIAEPLAWEESSGTGIILYAIGVGIRLGILDKETYMPVLEKGVHGLSKFCINSDYSIEKCCGSCCCPEGKGTVESYLVSVMPKRDDPHGFGPIIMALTEAERNGIQNIESK